MPNDEDQHLETPLVLHDAPLRQSDTAYFHFDPFARTLARLIASKDTRTPLAIGISGAWGSGKTTLLQRTCQELDATLALTDRTQRPQLDFATQREIAEDKFRICRTVWFDAWKYSDKDEMLVALVRVILNSMAEGTLGEQAWGKILDPTHPRYNVLATFLNMFKLKFGGVEIGADLEKYKTKTAFETHTAFFDFFDQAFEALLARWVHGTGDFDKIDESRGVLAVFIDDLDRCLPAKTVQVLEAIKLFLDKPGCVFVLGADTDVIRDAVASHYKDMRITGQNADDYLDKVIQLRFQLPPIVDAEMGKYLDGAQEVIDDEVRRNWRTIVTGAEINPRKVKRFVNDVNLQWAMLENTGQARGVNRDDFTRWQVLRGAASSAFMDQVEDLPPDLRRKFIDDAMKWARGDPSVAGSFKAYEGERRLIKVLKIVEFSEQLTPEALDAFVHLTQPPEPVAPPTAPVQELAVAKEVMPAIKGVRDLSREGEAIALDKDRRTFGGLPFVRVTAGKFIMGSKDDNALANNDEKPQHTVELAYDYWIARFPVTNDQFDQFVKATQHETTAEKEGGWSPNESKYVEGFNWHHPLGPKSSLKDKDHHPVVQVSWYDAMEYCKWSNQTLKQEIGNAEIRLPTEAEWEKAARGEYGNEWPWGNEFDPNKCNSSESGKGSTTPVDAYSPQGDSPYGVADMVGNVWEWCHSIFKSYPYKADDGRESEKGKGDRVVRGGSFLYGQGLARAAFRYWRDPSFRFHIWGLRVVVAPGSLRF